MNARASIGLTINISEDRDMGLEISNEDIPNYAIEVFVQYLYDALKTDEIYNIINVEVTNE